MSDGRQLKNHHTHRTITLLKNHSTGKDD